MSHPPSICIALQGKTSHVPPRYTVSDHPEICFGIMRYMVRYSRSCICHTEFGIRESEFGNPPVFIDPNQVHRNLHFPTFSPLTRWMMVR